jgi:hypothetical protein
VTVDWGKLADVLRAARPLFSQEALFPGASGNAGPSGVDRMRTWRPSPQLSVVARDWSGAQSLIGHLALTDRLRLSRSSRMVISRLRIADGTVVPFAQAGVGQWRVDTDIMPVMPPDMEPAAQFGGGLEVRIDSHCAVGLEADYTILYRQQHEPQMISGPHLWGGYFAARTMF